MDSSRDQHHQNPSQQWGNIHVIGIHHGQKTKEWDLIENLNKDNEPQEYAILSVLRNEQLEENVRNRLDFQKKHPTAFMIQQHECSPDLPYEDILYVQQQILNPYDILNFVFSRRYEFSTIFWILLNQGIDIRTAELFEVWTCLGRDKLHHVMYNLWISLFFSAQQIPWHYHGFEPNIVIDDIKKDVLYHQSCIGPETPWLDIFMEHITKTIIPSYISLEQHIKNAESPIIFSNYVIGSPDFSWDFPFWNLPGKHIHTFLQADLLPYTQREYIQDRTQTKIILQQLMHHEYGIEADITFGYFQWKNHIVMQYEILK